MASVIHNLREEKPGTHQEALDNITPYTGPFSRANVEEWVNDFLTLIPAELLPARVDPLQVGALKKFNITFEPKSSDGNTMGQWRSSTREAVLFMDGADMSNATVAKRVLFHELGHWLQELATPEGKIWLRRFETHFQKITAGRGKTMVGPHECFEGVFYDNYAGKTNGQEMLPMHLELLSSPRALYNALGQLDSQGRPTAQNTIEILRLISFLQEMLPTNP